MAVSLYLATTIGLFIATQSNGNWTVSGQALNGEPLTSVVVSEGVLLAGSVEGIWRSADNGKSWEKTNGGLSIPYVRWMAAESRTPGMILAGTEPAGIFAGDRHRRDRRGALPLGRFRQVLEEYIPRLHPRGLGRPR
jgi:hypothetical protein